MWRACRACTRHLCRSGTTWPNTEIESTRFRCGEGGESMDVAGVVGLGAMGSVFVERFVAAGVKTLAFDLSQSAMQHAQALGAEPYPSAAELAQGADIVDIMVRTDAQML